MSEVVEVIRVGYEEVRRAMYDYYGKDIFYKVAGAGTSTDDFLKALKSVPNYNAVVSSSGNIIGYEKTVTTTIATTGNAVNSTATSTVTTSTAFGATTTESGVTVTGVGQSTAGKAGSFIFGEVLPAVAAVSIGSILGVGIDAIIYESNPDYWDEVLPTINPQTWDDIILGHDTKIPLLHNTRTDTTYMDAEAFAYMTQAYAEAGAFSGKETATLPEYPTLQAIVCNMPQKLFKNPSGQTYWLQSVDWPGAKLVCYKAEPIGAIVMAIVNNYPPDSNKNIVGVVEEPNGQAREVIYNLSTNPTTLNGKTVYSVGLWTWNDTTYENYAPLSLPLNISYDLSRWLIWSLFYGNIQIESDAIDGISIKGDTPNADDFPRDMSLADGVENK